MDLSCPLCKKRDARIKELEAEVKQVNQCWDRSTQSRLEERERFRIEINELKDRLESKEPA